MENNDVRHNEVDGVWARSLSYSVFVVAVDVM